MGELGRSESRPRAGGGPGVSLAMEEVLLSEANDEHDLVSDDFLSFPLKKSFITLLFSSVASTSCPWAAPPLSSTNDCPGVVDRAA